MTDFAAAIERSPVMLLGDVSLGDAVGSAHAAIADRLTRRSLHQLHVAADDLRSCAHELTELAARVERGRAA